MGIHLHIHRASNIGRERAIMLRSVRKGTKGTEHILIGEKVTGGGGPGADRQPQVEDRSFQRLIT